MLFVFDRFEPVDYSCGVFPLVEDRFFHNCAVGRLRNRLVGMNSQFFPSTIYIFCSSSMY